MICEIESAAAHPNQAACTSLRAGGALPPQRSHLTTDAPRTHPTLSSDCPTPPRRQPDAPTAHILTTLKYCFSCICLNSTSTLTIDAATTPNKPLGAKPT